MNKCINGILQNRYTSTALNKRGDQNDGPKSNFVLHVRLGVGNRKQDERRVMDRPICALSHTPYSDGPRVARLGMESLHKPPFGCQR